jgi:hypothetical protein
MSWDAVAAIAEAVGALGIVVTLAYLAQQIRQNTAGMRLAARQALTHENSEFTKLLLDPEVGALFRRTNPIDLASLANPAGLSHDELIRFTNIQYIAFVNLESQYRAWRAGALSDTEWSASDALIQNVYLSSDASLDYWRVLGRGWHGVDFVRFIDEKIRALGKA